MKEYSESGLTSYALPQAIVSTYEAGQREAAAEIADLRTSLASLQVVARPYSKRTEIEV